MQINKRFLLLTVILLYLTGLSFGQKNKYAKKDSLVEITSSYGTIVVRLYPETPLHRSNFLKLAGEGFYDSTTFHRVIKEFMIQGGDPYSKDPKKKNMAGQGGPGYTIPAEIKPEFFHKKGVLAAARLGDQVNPKKESSGSQFYIVHGKPYSGDELQRMETGMMQKRPNFQFSEAQKQAYQEVGGSPWLDGEYTVFGEVISGLDVVDKIASTEVNRRNNRPNKDISISAKVLVMKKKKITKAYGFEYPPKKKKKKKK